MPTVNPAHFRPILRSFLNSFGMTITRSSNLDNVLELFERLWPRESNAELIRIGSAGDGGYLIPNALKGVETCISPGVGSTSSFERQLSQDFGIVSVLIDPNRAPVDLEETKHVYVQKYLGVKNHISFVSLDDLVLEFCSNSDSSILQMDIEGYEYENLMNVRPDLLRRFRVLVIEFHNVHHWLSRPIFELIVNPLFEKLLNDFFVVHIHPNNSSPPFYLNGSILPTTIEITLLNRQSSAIGNRVNCLPNKLDVRNVPHKKDIIFQLKKTKSLFGLQKLFQG